MESILTGTLVVKPLEASLHQDLEKCQFLNEAFCVVKLGEKTVKTKASKGTLLKPTWKDTITLHKHNENIVKIELWNKNQEGQIILMGHTEIPIAIIKNTGYSSTWYDLKKDFDNVGQMLIATEFISDSSKIDEEAPMEFESKNQFLENVRKDDKLLEAATGIIGVNKNMGNKNLSNRKTSEIIMPTNIKEKATKYRGSVEFDSQGRIFDIHDPQLLKKAVSQNEQFLNDAGKLNKMAILQNQANIQKNVPEIEKKLQEQQK